MTATFGQYTATFSLTNAPPAPGSMTATGSTPQSTTAGTAFRIALQVLVKDTGGTPESGVAVNFAVPGSGATATLSGSSAVTNSSGVASITATANATLGSYNADGQRWRFDRDISP